MTENNKRTGTQSEDLIEALSNRMFFSDFVVRNPKFKKPSGKEIEISDLLVPFGHDLIVFQVKSRDQDGPLDERTELDYTRISGTIEAAVDQVKTVKRAISNRWIAKLSTVRGIDIEIDIDSIERVLAIVVVDLIGEESLPRDQRTRLSSSYTMRRDIPIHVFTLEQFYAISRELDTLPDFLRFLHKTRELYESGLFPLPPDTLDFLAFYKMDPDRLDEVLESGTTLILEDGFWDAYLNNHADEIALRNDLNKPSYLVDVIIDYLHTSVGYDLSQHWAPPTQEIQITSTMGYLNAARELAALPRIERRLFGERISRCLGDAMKRKRAYSILIDQNAGAGYLILSTSDDRGKRAEFLHLIAATAYCYLGLNKIVSIATEPLQGQWRSYDVFAFAGVEFQNADELAKQGDKFFGGAHRSSQTEYSRGD